MAKQKRDIIKSARGMNDILPDCVPFYDKVIKECRRTAEFYGFQTIRTPHVEPLELFTNSLGEASDIIEKQMYNFRPRGGRPLVLRPEGTAPITRAYFENGMQSWPRPVKLFYNGSFFRHEKPQAGRKREFQQCGIELLGESSPINDALIIRVLLSSLESLHLRNVTININSLGDRECRPQFRRELLSYFKRRQQALCKDCKNRFKVNPLRLLDCKNESCIALKADAPQLVSQLCDECNKHFKNVLEFLDETSISYYLDPYLVRGLDYYSRTVFEIFLGDENTDSNSNDNKSDNSSSDEKERKEGKNEKTSDKKDINNENSKLAIGGGGRYDDLARALYGKILPSVGGSLGVDRIVNEMQIRGLKVRPEIRPRVFLIQLGPQARKKSFLITEELRKGGIPFSHSFSSESLRDQLKFADRAKVAYSIIIGQKEALDKKAIIRDMKSGIQETVLFTKIITTLKMRLKQL